MPYTIITGASAGIGYETAKGLASIGHNLILVARNYEKLKQIKKIFWLNIKLNVIFIHMICL